MEKSHIQKKLEENKFRRMLEALKGVAVRQIYYADDPTADSWREIYLHYVKHEWQKMTDCLKIPDSSTWEQICAALLEHHILFGGADRPSGAVEGQRYYGGRAADSGRGAGGLVTVAP